MQTFNLRFFIKKTKPLRNGKCPVYLRVKVNRTSKEFSIKQSVHPDDWLPQVQRASGHSKEDKLVNREIDSIQTCVHGTWRSILENGEEVDANTVVNRAFGKEEGEVRLLDYYQQQIDWMHERIGSDFRAVTILRYGTAIRHLRNFVKVVLEKEDLSIKQVDFNFLTQFEHFLKTKLHHHHNTAVKNLRYLKRIINIAFRSGLISKDPFLHLPLRTKKIDKVFLTKVELHSIQIKKFDLHRLNEVRDMFLFCCYTGLAYIDAKNLSAQHLSIDEYGNQWIKKPREKTNELSRIPILPPAMRLLSKYQNHLKSKLKGVCLPFYSNQKMNSYLKEIADLCSIDKKLTTHVARYTFATTIMASNGVPSKTLAKMMGHTNTQMTDQYAQMVDERIVADLGDVFEQFR